MKSSSTRTIITTVIAATAASVGAANLIDRGIVLAVLAGLGIGLVAAAVTFIVTGLGQHSR